MSKLRFCILSAALLFVLWATAQTGSVFEHYFANAVAFSKAFPREKVHLHLDNTSYYQGDTIWFKAYVVTADDNRPSTISKPLYVEMLDQLGNVMERHIVKLEQGQGCGQIPLTNALFTGYYEIRAYTRWMLAFDEEQYFSTTVPIYRKRLNRDEAARSIATYRMDKSMKQRPDNRLKTLDARFYPEGGQLVQGIQSVVGIETLSRDSGWVNLQGFLLSESGERVAPISTIHDGMGTFLYTPGPKPVQVEMLFKGKSYRFDLPKAEFAGYVMMVNNREASFDVTLSRSSEQLADSLALFTFFGGVPYNFIPITFEGNTSKRMRIMKSELPAGVMRIALINADGRTLCDRFCFSYPADPVKIEGHNDRPLYNPFDRAGYRLRITDAHGRPMRKATVSVAIRDGIETDYQPGAASIMTDLLLASDLKGYVHRPGFYFDQPSGGRRKLLDNLMLIRGWRKYDVAELIGKKTFQPKQLPEPNLTLYGHVDSWLGKMQAHIGVSILASSDSLYVSAATHADSLGNFSFPLDDFYGRMESLIQTKRDGKRFNRNATVSLYRNFEPGLREYDWCELNPQWENPVDTLRLNTAIDSLAATQFDADARQIAEIVVRGKKRRRTSLRDTEAFERDIVAFYNIRQYVDNMRDAGKYVPNDVGYLLHTINPKINIDGTRYAVDTLKYSVNGMEIAHSFIQKDVDMIETAMLYIDKTGRYAYKLDDTFRVNVSDLNDVYTHTRQDTASLARMKGLIIRCAFKMADNWSSNKNYTPTHGIRRTVIQGYDRPVAFYSPLYPAGLPLEEIDDHRRTLYWNPTLTTDDDGMATISYCNGRNTTYMNVSIETLVDGCPAALNTLSYPRRAR